MAGFKGFFTNHSLRATTATRLYESGIDEQLIAERTGHRSSAIREYKRTSDQLLKVVDDVVQNKRRAKPATSAATLPCSSRQESSCTSSPAPDKSQTTPISFTVERKGTKISFKM
ncbi:uncharacterized protein LOC124263442 [Haliotis rubra]|uniref:uncharacterized protein LOC124263442 n=1 Tax=Haliotis rubra TaxID=36100 RepID=UPI001EE54445|nr:uncharacterized protein LOC124263442 [Haliotis rubra]